MIGPNGASTRPRMTRLWPAALLVSLVLAAAAPVAATSHIPDVPPSLGQAALYPVQFGSDIDPSTGFVLYQGTTFS